MGKEKNKTMMTRRQKQVYDYIVSYVEAHGIAPTMQEIADHLGIKNRSNVHAFLKKMESNGIIRKNKNNLSRSVELVSEENAEEELRKEIERLREALRQISLLPCEWTVHEIAVAALKEG